MTILSSKTRKAVHGLRNEARTVQRSGDVLTSRKILENAEILRDEVERLEQERIQLIKQITDGRAGEQELMDEIVELRNVIAEYEEEQGAAEPQPLPADYGETAE